MATTRLISMHKNKGKSVADCISDRIDYAIVNIKVIHWPSKTDPLALV